MSLRYRVMGIPNAPWVTKTASGFVEEWADVPLMLSGGSQVLATGLPARVEVGPGWVEIRRA